MVKLQLLFPVGFCYVWALWFFQGDLHSSVVLVSLPLWLVLAARAAGFYALLLFAAWYAPQLRLWLCELVCQVVESEREDV
jgi:hypothetical protein